MNKKNIIIGGLAGLGVYTVYQYLLRKNNNPKEVELVLQNWLDTVCNHNPQAIVDLYAPDGVLLGTVAKTMKIGRQEIISYFDMFVKKRPCGLFTEINVQNFGTDYAVADGTYDFTLFNEDDTKEIVPARFTFVLRKIDGKWLIASHHSSANPE